MREFVLLGPLTHVPHVSAVIHALTKLSHAYFESRCDVNEMCTGRFETYRMCYRRHTKYVTRYMGRGVTGFHLGALQLRLGASKIKETYISARYNRGGGSRDPIVTRYIFCVPSVIDHRIVLLARCDPLPLF